jgi:catechol 2,3-dioxygenase-like lactoylglutathione lyase family enzyme
MPSLITDMAYVRLSAPDLGRMEEWLVDFGMVKVHRDARRLYMRGIGDAPFLHITELGEPGVISFAYNLRDPGQLAEVARMPGAQGIESMDSPGGGRRVRVRDLNGFWIELIADRERVAPLPPRSLIRLPDGESRVVKPARVVRLAHTAYMMPNLAEGLAWYQRTLGVIPTDELFVGERSNVLGQFDRVDLGDTLVDHHVIFLLTGQRTGMHHASFQVEAVDDIFFGHDYLRMKSYDHIRGIGRHALGSQIFDYWMSPFDQMHEHWISQERMNAGSKFNYIQIGEGMSYDSGEKPSKRFTTQASQIVAWSGHPV